MFGGGREESEKSVGSIVDEEKKERMNFIDGRSYKSTMVIVDWIYDSNGKVIELFFFFYS